jgi:hypothetical protein
MRRILEDHVVGKLAVLEQDPHRTGGGVVLPLRQAIGFREDEDAMLKVGLIVDERPGAPAVMRWKASLGPRCACGD